MYGLTPQTIEALQLVFSEISKIDKVIIYGSRAKGNHRHGSDIDITLLGGALDLRNSVYPAMDALEELYLPYSFDISIFDSIVNQELIDHIHRSGKVLYQRTP